MRTRNNEHFKVKFCSTASIICAFDLADFNFRFYLFYFTIITGSVYFCNTV